jgi:ribosomal protein S18 acetylase RimI-like enzyme
MITIRPGTTTDAAALARFAAATFQDAFGSDNRPEDMALHLERSYGLRQQTAELRDPAITTLFAVADDQLAGYAQVRPGTPPPSVVAAGSLELWRFYVDRPWHGKGVAQPLMDAVVAAARARGARRLWLSVWERNPRAQAFYRKAGFTRVGEKIFMVGTDPQTDHVMALALAPAEMTTASPHEPRPETRR